MRFAVESLYTQASLFAGCVNAKHFVCLQQVSWGFHFPVVIFILWLGEIPSPIHTEKPVGKKEWGESGFRWGWLVNPRHAAASCFFFFFMNRCSWISHKTEYPSQLPAYSSILNCFLGTLLWKHPQVLHKWDWAYACTLAATLNSIRVQLSIFRFSFTPVWTLFETFSHLLHSILFRNAQKQLAVLVKRILCAVGNETNKTL